MSHPARFVVAAAARTLLVGSASDGQTVTDQGEAGAPSARR